MSRQISPGELHQRTHDAAVAARDQARTAETLASALAAAWKEVARAEQELRDRTTAELDPAALRAFGPELTRSRQQDALHVSQLRLESAQSVLRKVESEL